MAREFKYAEAKKTATDILEEANKVQSYLNNCQNIINSNVGVSNKWTGERAERFKRDFETKAAEFKNFVEVIKGYQTRIDESYQTYKTFEEGGV